jgi:hypothetical protein
VGTTTIGTDVVLLREGSEECHYMHSAQGRQGMVNDEQLRQRDISDRASQKEKAVVMCMHIPTHSHSVAPCLTANATQFVA